MVALSAALPQLPSLSRLDVSRTALGAAGAAALATPLPSLPRLKRLDAVCNGFTDDGALELAATLPRATDLEHLGLGSNIIGPRGCRALAAALARLPALSTLDFSCNTISAMLPHLSALQGLRVLDLSTPQPAVRGHRVAAPPLSRAALAQHLAPLTGLSRLLLHNAALDEAAEAALRRAVPSLQHLGLRRRSRYCAQPIFFVTEQVVAFVESNSWIDGVDAVLQDDEGSEHDVDALSPFVLWYLCPSPELGMRGMLGGHV